MNDNSINLALNTYLDKRKDDLNKTFSNMKQDFFQDNEL